MRAKGELDAARETATAFQQIQNLPPNLLGASGVAEIDHHRPHQGAQPRLIGGPGRAAPVPVHVIEERHPATDHLQARQAGADIDILLGQACLQRPDFRLQPLMQKHVIGIPAQQRHGGVGMGIEQRRQHDHAAAIQATRPTHLQPRPDAGNAVIFDQDVAHPAVMPDIRK